MPPARRRLAVTGSLLALTLAAGGLAACGDVSKDKFRSTLVEKAGLTDAQAGCVTDKLYAELNQDQIDKIYSADKIEELTADEQKALTGAAISCATAGAAGTTTGG